jgi:hypothetical protein
MIEEQGPEYRSVAISPHIQAQRTLHFEPTLQRVNPGLRPLAPLRGVSQPELLKGPGRPAKKVLHSRSKSESAIVRKWHVEHSSLEERPTDFPPLPTTRTVLGTTADVISNRISDCLQSRSIKTRFSKRETNVAKCRSTDFCKFTIRLYEGEDGGVLVEIQRLCGDCISFMKDCRALLDAAEGRTEDKPSNDDKPLYLRMPVSQMSFMKTVNLPQISAEEEAESIDVTANLLASNQSDSNMLGIESLVVQTDPLKTLRSTAIMASRRVLSHDDPANSKFNIHNYVMELIIYGGMEETDPLEADSPATSLSDHSIRLRNLALSSLHNALTLFATENLLSSAISANRDFYANVLTPKLMDELQSAADQPHDACYASRCLCKLAEASPDLALTMKLGMDAIEQARAVGTREFALLSRDVESFHNALKCSV